MGPARRQPAQFDMDRISQRRQGLRDTGLNDVAHGCIGRHFPNDVDSVVGPLGHQAVKGRSGPDDETIRDRITAGNT